MQYIQDVVILGTVSISLLSVCSDYNVFSNFTLAFFEDSGWYKVNYTFVNNYDQFELQWGKGIKYITVLPKCKLILTEWVLIAAEYVTFFLLNLL